MINLSGNQITDGGLYLFTKAIATHKQIGYFELGLSRCQSITAQGITYFIQNGLKINTSIETLRLQLRILKLTDKDIAVISELLRVPNTTLKTIHLELSANKITSKGLKILANAINDDSNKLEAMVLSVCKNQIDSSCGSNFSKLLEKKKSLTYFNLDLSENTITDEFVQQISNGIEKSQLKTLQLNLSKNKQLTNNCMSYLGKAMEINETIVEFHLNLNHTLINDTGLQALSETMKNEPSCKNFSLNLGSCKISNIIPLSEALKNMSSLQKIKLDFSKCKNIN